MTSWRRWSSSRPARRRAPIVTARLGEVLGDDGAQDGAPDGRRQRVGYVGGHVQEALVERVLLDRVGRDGG